MAVIRGPEGAPFPLPATRDHQAGPRAWAPIFPPTTEAPAARRQGRGRADLEFGLRNHRRFNGRGDLDDSWRNGSGRGAGELPRKRTREFASRWIRSQTLGRLQRRSRLVRRDRRGAVLLLRETGYGRPGGRRGNRRRHPWPGRQPTWLGPVLGGSGLGDLRRGRRRRRLCDRLRLDAGRGRGQLRRGRRRAGRDRLRPNRPHFGGGNRRCGSGWLRLLGGGLRLGRRWRDGSRSGDGGRGRDRDRLRSARRRMRGLGHWRYGVLARQGERSIDLRIRRERRSGRRS